MRTDNDVKRDVEDELRYDPDMDSTAIGVSASNGVITLAGFVHSYSLKLQAEADAKRVSGVTGVANEINVRLRDWRTDPEIARNVVAQLKVWLPFSNEKVTCVVKGGWVTLDGEVEWNHQRTRAEDTARGARGVLGVSNLIKLAPRVIPEAVKAKIESALKRTAQVDAQRSASSHPQ